MSLINTKPIKQTADTTKSHQRIYNFLKKNHLGVLAMVDPNNDPHAAVVYYAIDNDFSMTFVTKRDTKKHDNIQHNNHVQVIVYEAESQTTVQIKGIAEDITYTSDAEEAYAATQLAAVMTSEAGVPPISKLHAGSYVVYRIRPVQVRMAVFQRSDSGSYNMFETIDF